MQVSNYFEQFAQTAPVTHTYHSTLWLFNRKQRNGYTSRFIRWASQTVQSGLSS